MSQSPETTYECSVCGAPVKMIDGQPQRECEHTEAPIMANMRATAYGEAAVQ